MSSLIGNIFGEMTETSADQTLALSAIGGASASAVAYLNATLQATTPEVRRLFADYLVQSITGQEAIVGLALKEGWVNPYESQENQIQIAYQQAENVLGHSSQHV